MKLCAKIPALNLNPENCYSTRAATCKIRAILAACPAHHIYEDNDHGTNEAMTKHITRIYFVRNTNLNCGVLGQELLILDWAKEVRSIVYPQSEGTNF